MQLEAAMVDYKIGTDLVVAAVMKVMQELYMNLYD